MSKNNYELWYSASNNTYSLFEADYKEKQLVLEQDSELLYNFFANDWDEAQSHKNKYILKKGKES